MTPQCLLSCCVASRLAAEAGQALYQHPQLLGGKLWFVEKPSSSALLPHHLPLSLCCHITAPCRSLHPSAAQLRHFLLLHHEGVRIAHRSSPKGASHPKGWLTSNPGTRVPCTESCPFPCLKAAPLQLSLASSPPRGDGSLVANWRELDSARDLRVGGVQKGSFLSDLPGKKGMDVLDCKAALALLGEATAQSGQGD